MITIKHKHFFFVRHAETTWNCQKLCQGQKDIPLNEKGLLDAKLFALEIQSANIECIVSSPLNRALQTAREIHHSHPDAKIQIVEELAERSWGELEGISSEQMYEIERSEEELLYDPEKGVESRYDFRKRVLKGIFKAQKYSPHPFIVSHGRVFKELCYLLDMPIIRQLASCQLVKITPKNNKWTATIIQRSHR